MTDKQAAADNGGLFVGLISGTSADGIDAADARKPPDDAALPGRGKRVLEVDAGV